VRLIPICATAAKAWSRRGKVKKVKKVTSLKEIAAFDRFNDVTLLTI
jgi:hypothetical protein